MTVVMFPVDRQRAEIERCARALHHKHGKTAEKWWQTECRRLYGRLQAIGLADTEARAHVDRFARAVFREFERGLPEERRHDHVPPGAA